MNEKELENYVMEKYFGCYIYCKKYISKNCNFFFDYEELLLWEYYLVCKRIIKNYNDNNNYTNIIITQLIKRMFQYYKRNKDKFDINYIDIELKEHIDYNSYIDIHKINTKKYPIVYDYLYNKYTVREILKKYNINTTHFYKELNRYYNNEHI